MDNDFRPVYGPDGDIVAYVSPTGEKGAYVGIPADAYRPEDGRWTSRREIRLDWCQDHWRIYKTGWAWPEEERELPAVYGSWSLAYVAGSTYGESVAYTMSMHDRAAMRW